MKATALVLFVLVAALLLAVPVFTTQAAGPLPQATATATATATHAATTAPAATATTTTPSTLPTTGSGLSNFTLAGIWLGFMLLAIGVLVRRYQHQQ